MAESTPVDDNFDPRSVPKPTAAVKCKICEAVGDWPVVQSPSYFLRCFKCDAENGKKDRRLDDYRNDLPCGNIIKGVRCEQYGCQKWFYQYYLCTTCYPPPKPGKIRRPLNVSFKAPWLNADTKVLDSATNTARNLDDIVMGRIILQLTDASEIESAIVKRDDNGDAKVITNLRVTVADLWEDPPAKVTLILHKRKH